MDQNDTYGKVHRFYFMLADMKYVLNNQVIGMYGCFYEGCNGPKPWNDPGTLYNFPMCK